MFPFAKRNWSVASCSVWIPVLNVCVPVTYVAENRCVFRLVKSGRPRYVDDAAYETPSPASKIATTSGRTPGCQSWFHCEIDAPYPASSSSREVNGEL